MTLCAKIQSLIVQVPLWWKLMRNTRDVIPGISCCYAVSGVRRLANDGNKVLPCQYTKHGAHDIQPAEWTLRSGAGRAISSHQPSDILFILVQLPVWDILSGPLRSQTSSSEVHEHLGALGPRWIINFRREFSGHQFTYVDSQYPCP